MLENQVAIMLTGKEAYGLLPCQNANLSDYRTGGLGLYYLGAAFFAAGFFADTFASAAIGSATVAANIARATMAARALFMLVTSFHLRFPEPLLLHTNEVEANVDDIEGL